MYKGIKKITPLHQQCVVCSLGLADIVQILNYRLGYDADKKTYDEVHDNALMHVMLKRKEKKPQSKDVAMVLRQNKRDNLFPRQGVKLCLYCGKPYYIVLFCYKTKNNEFKNTRNAKIDDDYTFVMHSMIHFKSLYKWFKNLETTKHMTLHRVVFNIYQIIAPHNVHLNDDSIVKAIGMGSIIMEAIMKGNMNCIHYKNMIHVSKLDAKLFLVTKIKPK